MLIYRLENVIQPYAWGSKTAIAELLGLPVPQDDPQAELWMGTHAKGPSMTVTGRERVSLQKLIEDDPGRMLGEDAAGRFGAALPYLFKVLAAARPLSIQAHPNRQEAVEGFARENLEKKPLDAKDRNYRDDNHKPEIICALTPFWAMNGFRSAEEAVRYIEPVCPATLNSAFNAFKEAGEGGRKRFFEILMTLSEEARKQACDEIVGQATALAGRSDVYRWMVALSEAYPADMGVLSPALLNLVCLSPGQAMYLPAGQLHAYLEGTGIELMANSDNVLRGGLTPKHVDLPELLKVVRFEQTTIELIEGGHTRAGESFYSCPAEEFALSRIDVEEGRPYASASKRSLEILLCIEGNGLVETSSSEEMAVKKGDSLAVPAGLEGYTLSGGMTLYKAAVPL